MAQSEAGKVSNIEMGQMPGGTKDLGPGKEAGLNKGLMGAAPRTGSEPIRDIPLLTRDVP